ncbi:Rha family transcriptional regulator [Rhizobium alvei]|uniref:Rha family transcriptional regulator n=1 Tax=Rhizobium alvei TaxID=1132659 RepID=A0ABT8YTE5_9HYPH|nr:Rha family transcriptional regulator [Rhizobium alvei]MDO6966993.1 Rha family transcriptional regulator [Rhizobium alvei]
MGSIQNPTTSHTTIVAERNPIVFMKGGEVVANSRDVAEYFEKAHKHVLDAIDDLIQREPSIEPNFRPIEVEVKVGFGVRLDRGFDMTRDGFTLLAMGFTGKKALSFKLKYIEAFNVMEAELRGNIQSARVKVNVPTNERLAVAREGRLQFRMFRSVARDIGLKGNQAVLSANRATKMTTGFDVMGALGLMRIDAEVNQPDLRPSDIAERLGIRSAQEANKLLVRFEYQNALRDHKGHVYYELTPKGERAGGVFKDTDKKTGHGVPIKQLMWASRIVDLLRSDMEQENA